ncbi:MAG: phosphatase domain-containing putative toxin [Candidatus Odinarchaeia archaeon]
MNIFMKWGFNTTRSNSALEGKPKEFRWLEKGVIAGSAAITGKEQLVWLKNKGINAIVNLTMTPLDEKTVKEVGLEYLFLPIDLIPDLEQISTFLKFIEEMQSKSKPVLVYCDHGLGRTGVMLAIYLINKGYTDNEAIKKIEENKATALTHFLHYNVIHSFYRYLKKKKKHCRVD